MSQLASYDSTSFVWALAGGALIGVSATLTLLVVGRVAGISGILAGVISPGEGDRAWKGSFLIGLILGGLALRVVAPSTVTAEAPVPLLWVLIAGLLVGVGTQLGSGCTSGHGVCGISRLAPRSIVATMTFMATGAAAVLAMRHILGASS